MSYPKLEHPRCDAPYTDGLLASSNYIAERKYDGHRAYLIFVDGKVIVQMRSGTIRSASVKVPYHPGLERTILDVEIYHPEGFDKSNSAIRVTGEGLKIAVIDVPWESGVDHRRSALELRHAMVRAIVKTYGRLDFMHDIGWVTEDKLQYFLDEVAAGREGIVLKKRGCGYGIGWVKVKGFKDTSVVVTGRDHTSGEQAYLIAVPDPVTARMIQLGTIKLFGKAIVRALTGSLSAGSTLVVDIKALSFNPKTNKFREPSLVKVRPDMSPLDCSLAKIREDFKV